MAGKLKPIILYDLDSTNEKRAWSLNTWKTRFILNYKRLPYETHWLEYPDIKPYFLSIGMEHSMIGPKTGNIYYLVPAITDPNKLTQDGKPTMLAGSWKIVEYLEENYPSPEYGAISLFPDGTKQLQKFFMDIIEDTEILAKEPIYELIVRLTHDRLKPESQEHFRTTREKNFGCELEEVCPEGEVRTTALEGTKAGFDKINSLFPEQDDPGLFTITNQICYADFVLASTLMWMRENAAEELWSHIRTWNEGRWERFLNALDERYGQVN